MSNDPAPIAVPRDAATIAIVRDLADGAPGVEVLLLRRTTGASFAAGAHVFPGGVVDASDADLADRLVEPPFGTEPRFAVAAVRECFEESGLLFATIDGSTPPWDDVCAWRRDLHAGVIDFSTLVNRNRLALDASSFLAWSRWITPVGSPKRFDTRFFVTLAPTDSVATPDRGEITSCEWFCPSDALARSERGEMLLITPTSATIRSLANATSTAELRRSRAADPAGQGALLKRR